MPPDDQRRTRIPPSSVLAAAISVAPHVIFMVTSLGWVYITLGQRVRRARKAFEKELIMQGMSIRDAERLGAHYNELEKTIVLALKQNAFSMRWERMQI